MISLGVRSAFFLKRSRGGVGSGEEEEVGDCEEWLERKLWLGSNAGKDNKCCLMWKKKS